MRPLLGTSVRRVTTSFGGAISAYSVRLSAYAIGMSLARLNVPNKLYVSGRLIREVTNCPVSIQGSGGRHSVYQYTRDVSVNACRDYLGNYVCYCTVGKGCGAIGCGLGGRSGGSPVLMKRLRRSSVIGRHLIGDLHGSRFSLFWELGVVRAEMHVWKYIGVSFGLRLGACFCACGMHALSSTSVRAFVFYFLYTPFMRGQIK